MTSQQKRKETYHDDFEYEELPEKFEGGLQNYAGIVGLGQACEYLSKLKLKHQDYFLVSSHREENVDSLSNFPKFIEMLNTLAKEFGKINFIGLVRGVTEKLRIVVTFIALLELIKMGEIGLQESQNFNDFEIYSLQNG